MGQRLKILVLCATVLFGIGLCAQAPSAVGTPALPPAAPTTVRLRGTISKYDVSTRTLSLSTPSGTVQLPVPPTARISRGSSKAEPAELEKLTGSRATVRYTGADDKRIVESIHVLEENQRRVR